MADVIQQSIRALHLLEVLAQRYSALDLLMY